MIEWSARINFDSCISSHLVVHLDLADQVVEHVRQPLHDGLERHVLQRINQLYVLRIGMEAEDDERRNIDLFEECLALLLYFFGIHGHKMSWNRCVYEYTYFPGSTKRPDFLSGLGSMRFLYFSVTLLKNYTGGEETEEAGQIQTPPAPHIYPGWQQLMLPLLLPH